MSAYTEFIDRKARHAVENGFEPIWLPDCLFDFQRSMVDWALRTGRGALYEDCGLGKTLQQLVWAENVVRHTNRPVLLVTPIAVGRQTVAESERFGIDAVRTRDGNWDRSARIFVTNYEQLHKYDPTDFAGMVCDESSAIKDFKSERKASVVEFMRRMRYRLLCTATAAPNDFWELGTSSEALGYLGWRDMITTFFKQETQKDHQGWGRTKYRFRGHAEQPFWAWVCSWARSLQKPSDLGFDDTRFVLPELHEVNHIVSAAKARPGTLFSMPAKDMQEERAERRHTLSERCEMAANIANAADCATVWCELNDESSLLAKLVKDCVEVSGSMSDEEKEEALTAFSLGHVKRIVTKPKIGAWGLNWQHCNSVVTLPSHSFEQYYQLVRRCYRFGQQRPVTVDRIVSEGEVAILNSIARKQEQATRMFSSIVAHMRDAMHLSSNEFFAETEKVPAWL